MPYNITLADRIQKLLQDKPGLESKKMFGGIGFMIKGNMACGVYNDFLIVRVGPDRYKESLARPHTKVFDITGRTMKGWVMVNSVGYESDSDLDQWLQLGIEFSATLPPK
jgi:TfoX/Sxy family transcriptional regulator of competence genes